MDFLTNVFHALRGIDWFILVLIGGFFFLSAVVGTGEGLRITKSSDFEVERFRSDAECNWNTYGDVMLYSMAFGLLLILFGNEAMSKSFGTNEIGRVIFSFLAAHAFGIILAFMNLMLSGIIIEGIIAAHLIKGEIALHYYEQKVAREPSSA
ncbi:MAG: hypothetical protein WC444_00485 [Candidatus Paceibacterota bacterium]